MNVAQFFIDGSDVMALVKDVICGMTIDTGGAQYMSEYKGKVYYFCSAFCRTTFDKNPMKYHYEAEPSDTEHTHQQ